MPGQVTWQEACDNVPMSRQEVYTVMEDQVIEKQVDDCQPTVTPGLTLCHLVSRVYGSRVFR